MAHTGLNHGSWVTAQTLNYLSSGCVPDVNTAICWSTTGIKSIDWPTTSDQKFLISLNKTTQSFFKPILRIDWRSHIPYFYSLVKGWAEKISSIKTDGESTDIVNMSFDDFFLLSLFDIKNSDLVIDSSCIDSLPIETKLYTC